MTNLAKNIKKSKKTHVFFKVFTKKGSKWAATPRWTGGILELREAREASDQSGAVVIVPDRYYGSSSSQTPSN